MTMQKKRRSIPSQDTILEQMRDVGTGMVKSVKDDLIGGVTSDILHELFSPNKKDTQGQEVFISQDGLPKPVRSEVRKPETVLFSAQEADIAQEVEALRNELKKTAEELKELNSAISEVEKTVALTPISPGKYHLSFFAKLRAILKLFREQISESRVWLEAASSKKKKQQYWSMFKKHGTTFGLSSERVVATQAR